MNTENYGFNQASHGHEDRITIMELLKREGYKVGHFGKWHIAPVEVSGTYGIDTIRVLGGGGDNPRGRDERIYAEAIAFIEENKDVPFYINVMGRVTHQPITPRPELIEAAGFSDLVVNRADFPGQQIQAIFDGVEAHGGNISESMASYLTEVYFLDVFIGELLAKLDELGLTGNTIVAFSSDQGPAFSTYPVRPVRRRDLTLVGWAGGLRGQKHDEHEGGVRSPFIIRWPRRVPAGKINQDSVISALDWLPTIGRVAGVPLDASDFHGEDVLDIWEGSNRSRIGPLYWENSMKQDNWRIYFKDRVGEARELYDLSADPEETNNLVSERRDVVSKLTKVWDEWQASIPQGKH